MKDLNVFVMADPHCGSTVGLTPPEFGFNTLKFQKGEYRKKMWKTYTKLRKSLPPIDVLVCNGDMIDGKQEKQGSMGLLTANISEQLDMAQACVETIDAKEIHIVKGTPYHVGKETDFEDELAKRVKAISCSNHKYLRLRGINFSFKHAIGSSTQEHLRYTPIALERSLNLSWNRRYDVPLVDIFVRSHVHYFAGCFGFDYITKRPWYAFTTPALQGLGGNFGSKLCRGTVDWGFLVFTIKDQKQWTWKTYIKEI